MFDLSEVCQLDSSKVIIRHACFPLVCVVLLLLSGFIPHYLIFHCVVGLMAPGPVGWSVGPAVHDGLIMFARPPAPAPQCNQLDGVACAAKIITTLVLQYHILPRLANSIPSCLYKISGTEWVTYYVLENVPVHGAFSYVKSRGSLVGTPESATAGDLVVQSATLLSAADSAYQLYLKCGLIRHQGS